MDTGQLNQWYQDVRRDFGYPALPKLKRSAGIRTAVFDYYSKEITVGERFLQELSDLIGEEKAAKAILYHELGHHQICPYDATTDLLLYRAAKSVTGKRDRALFLTGVFADVVVNTSLVKNGRTEIVEAWRATPKIHLGNKLLAQIYQLAWKQDLGAGSDYPNGFKQLAQLPYLKQSSWPRTIKRFVRLVDPYLPDMDLGFPSVAFGDYSDEEKWKAFRQLAAKVNSPHEYRELLEDFREELGDALDKGIRPSGNSLSRPRNGVSGGTEKGHGPTHADAYFYMHKAEQYKLPPPQMMPTQAGSLTSYSLADYEVGSSIHDLDLLASFGKILPGLAKQRIYRDGEEGPTPSETRRPLLVLVDSSGSMPHPGHQLSLPVMGAGCLADAALAEGKPVAVYNFGAGCQRDHLQLDFTRDRPLIYSALCTYFSGGTNPNIKAIEAIRKHEPHCELALISDLQLSNGNDVEEYLANMPNPVRILYHGGPDDDTPKDAVENRPNMTAYTFGRLEDLEKLAR